MKKAKAGRKRVLENFTLEGQAECTKMSSFDLSKSDSGEIPELKICALALSSCVMPKAVGPMQVWMTTIVH